MNYSVPNTKILKFFRKKIYSRFSTDHISATKRLKIIIIIPKNSSIYCLSCPPIFIRYLALFLVAQACPFRWYFSKKFKIDSNGRGFQGITQFEPPEFKSAISFFLHCLVFKLFTFVSVEPIQIFALFPATDAAEIRGKHRGHRDNHCPLKILACPRFLELPLPCQFYVPFMSLIKIDISAQKRCGCI